MGSLLLRSPQPGSAPQAWPTAPHAVALCRESGDQLRLITSIKTLGHIAADLKDYQGSRAAYSEAADLSWEMGISLVLAHSVRHLGDVFSKPGFTESKAPLGESSSELLDRSTKMKLIVFGATGATGRLLIESALAAEHSVTAFVRDSKRLPMSHSSLRIVEGDAMDRASVASALPGQEAVICALGTMPEAKGDLARRQPGVPVCSVGTKNILAAMDSYGCRRLLIESSASVGDSFYTGFLGAGFIVRMALRQVMADKELQEAATAASACDWTILRPVKLTNAPAKGNLRSGIALRWNIASRATRADVANYMVKILADSSTYRKALTLRN